MFFSLFLPIEYYIHEEISFEEYCELDDLQLKPPDLPRILFNKGNINIKKASKRNELITEEEYLGMYI